MFKFKLLIYSFQVKKYTSLVHSVSSFGEVEGAMGPSAKDAGADDEDEDDKEEEEDDDDDDDEVERY